MDRFITKKPKLSKPAALIKPTQEDPTPNEEPKNGTDMDNTGIQQEHSEEPSTSRTSYSRGFKSEWRQKFDWLEAKNGNAFCMVCFKALTNCTSHLSRHNQSTAHKKKYCGKKGQPAVDIVLQNSEEIRFKNKVNQIEETIVMFFILHHLPFALMDHFIPLLKTCFPECKLIELIHCGKTKALQIVKDVLAKKGRQKIINELKINSFSLIVDETTDVSCCKALVLVARHFDSATKSIKDSFLCLIELIKTDAETITKSILDFLAQYEIPLQNCIGLATDNASVMKGEMNGVQALLKRKISKDHFFMGCICHSLHLCASYACRKLPIGVEQLARDIYNVFAHSAKRVSDLKEFQEFCNLKPHKILRPCQTRWLSLQSVVDRILEQWRSLSLFLVSGFFEDNSEKCKSLAEKMNDESRLYFLFLVNKMNIEFQSSEVRIHILLKNIEAMYRNLLSNFIKTDNITRQSHIEDLDFEESAVLNLNNVYAGVEFEDYAQSNDIDPDIIASVKDNIVQFYLELCRQIRKRIDFKNNKLKVLFYLDPKCVKDENAPNILNLLTLER